jgi:multicomponent Na+:H+ antiporter subunit A
MTNAHPPVWVRLAWLFPLAVAAASWTLPDTLRTLRLDWVPALGVELAFASDALSRLFLLIAGGIGAAVFLYAPAYLDAHRTRSTILLLAAFLVAMAGTVLADNLLLLFAFWEATSIISFLLIGYDHEAPEARKSALRALLVTGLGGLVMLAGIVLILQAAPHLRISDIPALPQAIVLDSGFQAGVALVAIGAFTKSAQVPFHFWLPGAMAAPAPVSAYLHSATMVNLGVYVLARFDEAAGDLTWWTNGLAAVGACTAVVGALQGLRQRDMKLILAWSTVSALGMLTLLIALPNDLSALAFVSFLLAHALYKAPLFFVAGTVDHTYGTRRIDVLRGLRRQLPWTAAAAALAAVSMAGLPLTMGFVAKAVTKSAKELTGAASLLSSVGLVVGAISIAVASVIAGRVFFGRPNGATRGHVEREPVRLVLPALLVALAGILLEIIPGLAESLLLPAANVIAPGLDYANVDPNGLLVAGTWLATLLLGAIIFAAWDPIHRALEPMSLPGALSPGRAYDRLMLASKDLAGIVTRNLHRGRLRTYTFISLAAFLAIALPWAIAALRWQDMAPLSANPGLALGALVASAGALLAALPGDVMRRLLGVGTVGIGSSIVFLFAGAPDLALTQLLVETVFVAIAAVTLARYKPATTPTPRPWAAVLAVAFGIDVAILAYALLQPGVTSAMSQYFLNTSLVEAHGRNVVNVIIVDFRGLDTLGEIIVVLVAALAITPLLRQERAATSWTRSPMTVAVIRPLYWILLAAAAWLYWRGHNEPGGGFLAALVATAATTSYAIIMGPEAAKVRLPLRPLRLSALGVALAMASGLPALAAGQPYLTHFWATLGTGAWSLKVSTVPLFDLGVLLCVWGALAAVTLRLLEARHA